MKKIFFTLRTAAIALLLFAVVANTIAQKQTPPAGGQPKPFVFPKQEVYTLPNGMKVTLVPYGSVPKVAFQAVIYAGTKDDAKGKKALSEMVGMMLKEGTQTHTAEQIARETAEMGGGLNVGTGTDSTNLSGEVLTEFGPQFVALLADVIQNPHFKSEDLERIRANKLRDACRRPNAGRQSGVVKVSRGHLRRPSLRTDQPERRRGQRLYARRRSQLLHRVLRRSTHRSLRGRQVRHGGG